MTPSLRRAIETVVCERGLKLDQGDIEALVRVAASASTWVGDTEAMHRAGRSNVDSLRAWCSRHNVTRTPMTNLYELDQAVDAMPGRGHYPRIKEET